MVPRGRIELPNLGNEVLVLSRGHPRDLVVVSDGHLEWVAELFPHPAAQSISSRPPGAGDGAEFAPNLLDRLRIPAPSSDAGSARTTGPRSPAVPQPGHREKTPVCPRS